MRLKAVAASNPVIATPYSPFKAKKFLSANGSMYIICPRVTGICINLKFIRSGENVVISQYAISNPCMFYYATVKINPFASTKSFKVKYTAGPNISGGKVLFPRK